VGRECVSAAYSACARVSDARHAKREHVGCVQGDSRVLSLNRGQAPWKMRRKCYSRPFSRETRAQLPNHFVAHILHSCSFSCTMYRQRFKMCIKIFRQKRARARGWCIKMKKHEVKRTRCGIETDSKAVWIDREITFRIIRTNSIRHYSNNLSASVFRCIKMYNVDVTLSRLKRISANLKPP